MIDLLEVMGMLTSDERISFRAIPADGVFVIVVQKGNKQLDWRFSSSMSSMIHPNRIVEMIQEIRQTGEKK